jgi:hypothetical protein
MINKEKYRHEMQSKFDELTLRVEMLKTDIANADADEKLILYEILESIRSNQESVARILLELNSTPDSAWEDLKLNLETLWHELTESVEQALKRLK